jgi:hypothetical protein
LCTLCNIGMGSWDEAILGWGFQVYEVYEMHH